MATRLFAYVQAIPEGRPIAPGSAVGITLRVRSSGGDLEAHTAPLVSITDPAGGLILEDVPMTAEALESSLYWESETTSMAGTYRIDAKCTVTVPQGNVELVASTRFNLSEKPFF